MSYWLNLLQNLGLIKPTPWYQSFWLQLQNSSTTYSILPYLLTIFVIYLLSRLIRSRRRQPKSRKKTETYCRTIVEKLFNRPFPSVRPNWLNNPQTGKNLELDMYNEQLKLAFEYNGAQHSGYHQYFHRSPADFDSQVERDQLKQKICQQNGITLISIPHTVPQKKLKEYIQQQVQGFLH